MDAEMVKRISGRQKLLDELKKRDPEVANFSQQSRLLGGAARGGQLEDGEDLEERDPKVASFSQQSRLLGEAAREGQLEDGEELEERDSEVASFSQQSRLLGGAAREGQLEDLEEASQDKAPGSGGNANCDPAEGGSHSGRGYSERDGSRLNFGMLLHGGSSSNLSLASEPLQRRILDRPSNPSPEASETWQSIRFKQNSNQHAKKSANESEDTESLASTSVLSKSGKANKRRDRRKAASKLAPRENQGGEDELGQEHDHGEGDNSECHKNGQTSVGVQCDIGEAVTTCHQYWMTKYVEMRQRYEEVKELLLMTSNELSAVKRMAGLADSDDEQDGYSVDSETSLALRGAFDEQDSD